MNIFADKCANFKCESTHSTVKYIEILNSLSTSDIPDVSAQHGPDGVRHRGRADLHDRALRGGLGMGGNICFYCSFQLTTDTFPGQTGP